MAPGATRSAARLGRASLGWRRRLAARRAARGARVGAARAEADAPRTLLLLGKTGSGKSSLTNALCGAEVSRVDHFAVGTTQVDLHDAVRVNEADGDEEEWTVVDSPGFFDVERRTPAGVLRELAGKVRAYHAVCWVQDCADPRVRAEDRAAIKLVAAALGVHTLGPRLFVALTKANAIEPERRADALANKSLQLTELFGEAGLAPPPTVAAGRAGEPLDGQDWLESVWRAAESSAALGEAEVSLDRDALAELDVVLQEPPPPPPLEAVHRFQDFVAGTWRDEAGQERAIARVDVAGLPPAFAARFVACWEPDASVRAYMLMPGRTPGGVLRTEVQVPQGLQRKGGALALDGLPAPLSVPAEEFVWMGQIAGGCFMKQKGGELVGADRSVLDDQSAPDGATTWSRVDDAR